MRQQTDRSRWSAMQGVRSWGFVGLLVMLAGGTTGASEPAVSAIGAVPGIRLPRGFRATLFADDDLASNIYSMTIDARGRVVVAGPGYVRALVDRNRDGKAESAIEFSKRPANGAQGLFFDGNDLLATGDGAMWRISDADGDGRSEGNPKRLLVIRAGGEHDAHAIRRGPDGWFYLLAGNGAGVTAKFADLPSSPIKKPSAGTLLRLPPDLSASEILVDGFRNAYDFAFNAPGDLFVYDSDGERDVSLPWYRPTRVFHALPAHNTGWFSRSWKRPDHFVDMPPVVGSLGRGSPTGVCCYRHLAFPREYRGAVFACDWTFGRVIALTPPGTGAGGLKSPETFMSGRGHFGFAPTDIAVGPDGALYVAVGGRGTRGGVYRITHPATKDHQVNRRQSIVETCLAMPQPLASWSRARWLPLAKSLGRKAIVRAIKGSRMATSLRVRAVEVLVDVFGGEGLDEIAETPKGFPSEVRARLAWGLGRVSPVQPNAGLLAKLLLDREPLVGRAACEALVGVQGDWDWQAVTPGLVRQLGSEDRRTRQVAAAAVARMPRDAWREFQRVVRGANPTVAVFASVGGRAHVSGIDLAGLTVALDVLSSPVSGDVDVELKRDAARLAQLAIGDVGPRKGRAAVFDGYGPLSDSESLSPIVGRVTGVITSQFPSRDRLLDRELSRLAGMVGASEPGLLQKMLDKLTTDSDPVSDLHFLIVSARLPLERTKRQRQTMGRALLDLQAKIDRGQQKQDRNWDDRVSELYDRLCQLDPQLPSTIASETSFGLPSHVVFLNKMSRAEQASAREAFARVITETGEDYPWTGEVVRLVSKNNDRRTMRLLRRAADQVAVRGAALEQLAKRAEPGDRGRFVSGLSDGSLGVVAACLGALAKLPAGRDGQEQLALLGVVRRMGDAATEHRLRSRAVALLRRNTGKKLGFDTSVQGRRPQPEAVARWTQWIEKAFPEASRSALGAAAASLPVLKRRWATVDWGTGDAGRGKQVFTRRGCVQCHQGRRALGPDLAGAAGRFSREDLLTAIELPNRDVSPRYQTTVVTTSGGKVYNGLVVYQSVDGITLRTGTNQTIRLEQGEIEYQSKRPESLMPAGLLKKATNQDLADLYAYLKILR